MNTFIHIIQIVSAILLILAILSQSRGGGLGAAFGDTGGFYASKRGVEKILAVSTAILAGIFLLSSFLYTIVQ